MIKLGMVGLDTSHVSAFTKLLHSQEDVNHVAGAKVVVAFPGGSPDFPLSINRVEQFTNELRDTYGVRIVDSIEAVAEASDAILLESVDGRVHREQLEKVASYGKPVFIDKPFAASLEDAEAMVATAKAAGIPVMSCSALRFAEAFRRALETRDLGPVTGLDVYGPMALQEQLPGLYWYGIHVVEMLIAGLGPDFVKVSGEHSEKHDVLSVVWSDGRIGTLRGNREENNGFGGTVHFAKGSVPFQVKPATDRPFYASLLERVIPFFEGKENAASPEEALAVTRLIHEGNAVLGY